MVFYILWVVWGVLFGMLNQGWAFGKSLLFAVAAMSTAGLVAPSTGNDSMLFTSFYSLTGIIIFALLVGAFAEYVLEILADRELARRARLTSSERRHLKEAMFTGRDEIDFPGRPFLSVCF